MHAVVRGGPKDRIRNLKMDLTSKYHYFLPLNSFLHIHVDLEIYSLSVTNLFVFAPIPGNQNVERREDPNNEEIGFDVCSRAIMGHTSN